MNHSNVSLPCHWLTSLLNTGESTVDRSCISSTTFSATSHFTSQDSSSMADREKIHFCRFVLSALVWHRSRSFFNLLMLLLESVPSVSHIDCTWLLRSCSFVLRTKIISGAFPSCKCRICLSSHLVLECLEVLVNSW